MPNGKSIVWRFASGTGDSTALLSNEIRLEDGTMAIRITEGFGYYKLGRFPIGGDFHRAPKGGVEVIGITKSYDGWFYGCNCEVQLADGSKAAVNNAHLEQDYQ